MNNKEATKIIREMYLAKVTDPYDGEMISDYWSLPHDELLELIALGKAEKALKAYNQINNLKSWNARLQNENKTLKKAILDYANSIQKENV